MLTRLTLVAMLAVAAYAGDFAPNAAVQEQLAAEADVETLLTQYEATDLYAQLLYQAAHATNNRAAMYAAATQKRLPLRRQQRIELTVDLLGGADAKLDRTVRSVLAAFEGRTATRTPDLSVYRELLAQRIRDDEALSPALVDYLFAADPHAAVVVLMRAHQVRAPQRIQRIRWAAHLGQTIAWRQTNGFAERTTTLRNELADALNDLAADPAWWVQRYVAALRESNGSRP